MNGSVRCGILPVGRCVSGFGRDSHGAGVRSTVRRQRRMLDLKRLYRPADPEEAVRAYAEASGSGLYVAGGTVIVPAGSANLDFLVDVTSTGLDYVRREDGHLVIGATTRLADLHESEEARTIASAVLSDSALAVANHTVRNLATVGGNLASWAFPSDLPPALLALDASIVVLAPEGRRDVRLRDFYGNRRDVFRKGDLITEVRVPPAASDFRGGFEKIGRKKLDVAVVNAAAALALDGGVVRDARIAMNGVGAVPVRAAEAEAHLRGAEATPDVFSEAGRIAASVLSPRTDHRASGEYRRKVAAVAVERALMRASGFAYV